MAQSPLESVTQAMAPDPALLHRCERMAELLVQAGRVVPALVRDGDGQLRARWWPLPAAEDRPWLEAMLPADDLNSQQQLAEALAAAVDRCVRQRLQAGAPTAPMPASGSRPSQRSGNLPDAWLAALAREDSLLPDAADAGAAANVSAEAGAAAAWGSS